MGAAVEDREQRQLGVSGGEGVGDVGGLGAGEGAHGVDEAAAGFEGGGGVFEKLALELGEFSDVGGRGGPAVVGMALPGAHAAARSVEEDTVEFRFRWQHGAAAPLDGAGVVGLGAGGPFAQVGEATGGAVAGPDDAFAAHEVGEVKGLAALAGAGIPPSFAGHGGAGVADELGGEVLDLEEAVVKFVGLEEVFGAGVAEGVGGGRGGGRAGAEGAGHGGAMGVRHAYP